MSPWVAPSREVIGAEREQADVLPIRDPLGDCHGS